MQAVSKHYHIFGEYVPIHMHSLSECSYISVYTYMFTHMKFLSTCTCLQICSFQAWWHVGICTNVHTEVNSYVGHIFTCLQFLNMVTCQHVHMHWHTCTFQAEWYVSGYVCISIHVLIKCCHMLAYTYRFTHMKFLRNFTCWHVHIYEVYEHHLMVTSMHMFKCSLCVCACSYFCGFQVQLSINCHVYDSHA